MAARVAAVSAGLDAAAEGREGATVADRRALTALCQRRLRARLGARFGWLFAVGIVMVAAMIASTLDAREHTHTTLVWGALRWLCWLGAGPLALAVAASPARRDRDDGIETLVLLRGGSARQLANARTVAAMTEAALRIGLPGVSLCLVMAAFGPTRLLLVQAIGVAIAAALAGIVVGGVASACGRYGGRRGRSVLMAVVLLPWIVSDLWAVPQLSIPGAIDATLALLTEVGNMTARWV